MPRRRTRVVILGGGYVGLYVAWGLEKHSDEGLEVTIVDPRSYMTYQPLLPEVAGGHVEPRNVTVDLRQALKYTTVLQGSATGLDAALHTATVRMTDGSTTTLEWDHVVVALGAVTRTLPVPGLAEQAVGFKTLDDAVYTRNAVLRNLAKAAATSDPAERDRLLTFVAVGGGYTGVEALAELSDLSGKALDSYPELAGRRPKWVLVEALDRVAPEVGPTLSKWSLGELGDRGIDVHLKTTMTTCEGGDVVLSDGTAFSAGLIVWTAGVKPNPALDGMGLPRGPKGHVVANARMQVVDEQGHWVRGVWAAGDAAQIPDLTKAQQPAFYPPNAQNAVRQATQLAESIPRAIRGRRARPYKHYSLGTVASYGILRGAANIHGVELKDVPAWLAHRAYHLFAMPTTDRKLRILAGWVADALGKPDLTASDDPDDARADFARLAGPPTPTK